MLPPLRPLGPWLRTFPQRGNIYYSAVSKANLPGYSFAEFSPPISRRKRKFSLVLTHKNSVYTGTLLLSSTKSFRKDICSDWTGYSFLSVCIWICMVQSWSGNFSHELSVDWRGMKEGLCNTTLKHKASPVVPPESALLAVCKSLNWLDHLAHAAG